MIKEEFQIKSYSKSELANLYNVNIKTFVAWLKKMNLFDEVKFKKILTPLQVKKITEHLGNP